MAKDDSKKKGARKDHEMDHESHSDTASAGPENGLPSSGSDPKTSDGPSPMQKLLKDEGSKTFKNPSKLKAKDPKVAEAIEQKHKKGDILRGRVAARKAEVERLNARVETGSYVAAKDLFHDGKRIHPGEEVKRPTRSMIDSGKAVEAEAKKG